MGNAEKLCSGTSYSGSVMERVYIVWAKRCCALFAPLSRNILSEVCSYLAYFGQLVDVAPSYLRFFNFAGKRWGPKVPLHCAIQVTDISSWVVLQSPGKCRVFCCGGSNGLASNRAYMLSADGAVQPQPNLLQARGQHGLIQWRYQVFVFGGVRKVHSDNNSPMKSGESLQLHAAQNWLQLPRMQRTRHSFNPCLHGEVIYLSGSCLEVYSPERCTFLPLRMELPEYSSCCVYSEENVLVVHTLSFVFEFQESEGKVECLRTSKHRSAVCKLQNSQPVVDATSGLVYFVSGGRCISFSGNNGEIVQVFR